MVKRSECQTGLSSSPAGSRFASSLPCSRCFLATTMIASILLGTPAIAAVPISNWGFLATLSDTTYVVTADLTEPPATQGTSGSSAILVLPSVHNVVIEGGGFLIDGRDTAGTPDLDAGILMLGLASGPVNDIVIRDLRFTDISKAVSGLDYLCNVLIEDCEFSACVNQAAVEMATEDDGAFMSWITVRDSWFHDGEGVPILFRNTANAGPGTATMSQITVAGNVIDDYRCSPGHPEPWNAGITFIDGAADVFVFDNIVLSGDGESGLFIGSDDAPDARYDRVTIRGNSFAGSIGTIDPPELLPASGMTIDRVTTTGNDFSTWSVTGNTLVQNEGAGVWFVVGANSPPSLPTLGNWWGEDGTVGGTYGNGAVNATDPSPLDLPDGILARPDRGASDRAVTRSSAYAGMIVLLNQNEGPPGIRGFEVDYDFATRFDFVRCLEGPFLRNQATPTQFYDNPRIGGAGNERTASGAILGGGAPLAVGNGVLHLVVLRATGEDLSSADDFFIDGVALRDPANFPVAVVATDDADRPIDDTEPAASLTPPAGNPCVGSEQASVDVGVGDGFALEHVFYRFYRIDECEGCCWTPLALDEPGTTYSGPPSVPVSFDLGEGLYAFEISATDDAGNVLRDQLVLLFDETPPADFAGTTTAYAVAGGTPAVEEVFYSWDGTFEEGADLRLRYLPYGGSVGNFAYPEYDDDAPVPGPHFPGPAEGTEVDLPDTNTGSVVLPFTIAERSYYYLTLFVVDCAGNPSPGIAAGARVRSLSYYLGDWDASVPPACPGSPEYTSGNGEVNFCDLIGMSRAFGTAEGDPDYDPHADIGPTTPGPGPLGRPVTDNLIDFEDVILFAINFEAVAPFAGGSAVGNEPAGGTIGLELLTLRQSGDRITVGLVAGGDLGALQGFEAVIDPGGLALAEVRAGSTTPQRHFLRGVEDGDHVRLCLAFLGPENRAAGPGVLAELDFVALLSGESRDPGSELPVRLQGQKLRDRWNRELAKVTLAASGSGSSAVALAAPARHALLDPVPNPFNPTTTIRYAMPAEGRVRIVVYDSAGRLVARLHDGLAPSGEHELIWHAGERQSGVYLVEMTAGSFRAVEKLLLIK